MAENQDIIRIQEKLESLLRKQTTFQREIEALQSEISLLKSTAVDAGIPPGTDQDPPVNDQRSISSPPPVIPPENFPQYVAPAKKSWNFKSDLEKFVGENLINKIGISITIIGVGIGAKYAIDHDLISPWTRIILGYLVGIALIGFAVFLKKQYHNFSAVLFSGAMAILYFLTFAAFSFYNLIPLWLTFAWMVVITIATVAAAISYNQQVIANIGLVGAYAVPFLLSNDSGNVTFLFSYMALINTGILIIAIKRYWKSLYYSSFIISWLIVVTWYTQSYQPQEHFRLALIFLTVFFILFYTIRLAYKLLNKELFNVEDILMILGNSSVFYGLVYAALVSKEYGETALGLFTLANALIHFMVWLFIYKQKECDRNLMYFTGGLSLTFLTIAVPVGLNGQWVTMLWSAEVAFLFWIGRTKNTTVYELISYPLMFLTFWSLIYYWLSNYYFFGNEMAEPRIIPIFNKLFLTSAVFIASLGFINLLNSNNHYITPLYSRKWLVSLMSFSIPAMLIMVLYFSFVLEISTFWNQIYESSVITLNKDLTLPQHLKNANIVKYNYLSIINYSLLFLSILSFANTRRFKSSLLGLVNLGLNVVAIAIFLTMGLYTIGELRDSYLSQADAGYFYRGEFNIVIRYISFVFLGVALFAVKEYVSQQFMNINLAVEFDFFLQIALLTIVSNELINWMDLFKSEGSYKLGLSILWGVYSMLLIAYGIWKKKKHLRIGAILLFAITLIKLFLYDISFLDTISKTIVFVSLGVLLLIISFLYNKYKKLII